MDKLKAPSKKEPRIGMGIQLPLYRHYIDGLGIHTETKTTNINTMFTQSAQLPDAFNDKVLVGNSTLH